MSTANITLGHKAQVRVNNTVLAVTQGTVTFTADSQDVTESEQTTKTGYNAPSKKFKGGLRSMTFNIQGHLATDVSPHAAPLNIREGTHQDVAIYPHGIAAGQEPYRSTLALIETWEIGVNPKTSEPEMFTLTGNNGLSDPSKPGDSA